MTSRKPNSYRRWTPEDLGYIGSMLSRGYVVPEIAEHFGRSTFAVASVIDEMKAHYGAHNHAHLVAILIKEEIVEP